MYINTKFMFFPNVILAFLLFVSIFCPNRVEASGHQANLVESQMVKKLSEKYGRDAFLVEARGQCMSGKPEEIALSPISWSRDGSASHQLSPEKVEEDLDNNSFLSVRRSSAGPILIRWKNISKYVLQENLPEVKFADYFNQTSPAYIINKLWYSKVMLDQLKSGRIEYVGPTLGLFSSARATNRHLDGKINNVSVEDVLIRVASTFGGIIFYAECPRHGGIDYYVNYYYPENW